MNRKLYFALRNERWVHIGAVARGKACQCTCPACGTELIAKKGAVNQHHFAHAFGRSCTQPLETVLHRLAKAILVHEKRIRTPLLQPYRAKLLRTARLEVYSHAREEATYGKIRLDVLLYDTTQRLGIEIQVTNPCSERKIDRLAQLGFPVVELDMRRIYQQHLLHYPNGDLYQLAHTIVHGSLNRRWCFHPWAHRYEYRLARTATERTVKISKQGNYHHYHVYRCPRRLRFVRGGFRDGQAYARVFQDCLHCSHCREIRYQQEHVGYRRIVTLPESVFCGAE